MEFCVIGSSSFAASHFIKDKLLNGYKVLAISRSGNHLTKLLLKNLKYKNRNFLELRAHLINDNNKIISALEKYKPRYVVDFSGQGMVAESWNQPELWFETNVLSKIKIYKYLVGKKWLSKLIKISTPEVYGNSLKKLKEDSRYNPSTPYAVSHASIDMFLKINHSYKDLPVIIARFANFYGEGQQSYRIIPRVILSIIFKKKFELHGGGKSIRSFIHAKDVSNAINKCLIKGKKGETYHFSTNEQISIYNISKKIIEQSDISFNDICVIKKVDRLGKDLKYDMCCSFTKNKLNWKPKIKLNHGLIETFKWFYDNKKIYEKINWEYKNIK